MKGQHTGHTGPRQDATRRTRTTFGAATKLVLLEGEPEDIVRVGGDARAANKTLGVLQNAAL
jgi:hypothetical protein